MPDRGYLALVVELHHPWPGMGRAAGRDWALAAAETYWPLARALANVAQSGAAEVLTVAVSPNWTALAADATGRQIALAELARRVEAAGPWQEHWRSLHDFAARDWHGDLLGAFNRAAQSGAVELITTTATPAWLPALADQPVLARAQVALAVADVAGRFGIRPQGLWLPHLAYRPGLETAIAASGARYFGVDAEAFVRGTVWPPAGRFGPLVTAPGAATFGVDQALSHHLVDSANRYARDPRYADPWLAQAAVADHVTHFLSDWLAAIAAAPRPEPHPPISVVGLNAHELGGLWTAGAHWLEQLLMRLADIDPFASTTPGRYLDRFADGPVGRPGPSAGGILSVRPGGSDLLEDWRSAGEILTELIERRHSLKPAEHRAIAAMIRLWLQSQSLDWHLPPGLGRTTEEGLARARDCLGRFAELHGLVISGHLELAQISLEPADGPVFLPEIDLNSLAEG